MSKPASSVVVSSRPLITTLVVLPPQRLKDKRGETGQTATTSYDNDGSQLQPIEQLNDPLRSLISAMLLWSEKLKLLENARSLEILFLHRSALNYNVLMENDRARGR